MYLFHVFQSRQTASRWRKESDDPTCYPRRNVSTPTRSISIAKLFKKTKEEFEKDEKEFSAARDLMHICLPPPFHLKSLHKKCHQISLGIQATLYLRTVNRIGLISYFPKNLFLSLPDFQRWIKSFCVRSSRLDCSCKGPKGQIYFPKDLTLCVQNPEESGFSSIKMAHIFCQINMKALHCPSSFMSQHNLYVSCFAVSVPSTKAVRGERSRRHPKAKTKEMFGFLQ